MQTGEYESKDPGFKWCTVHQSREPKPPWYQGRCWFALHARRRSTDEPCEFIEALGVYVRHEEPSIEEIDI